MDVLALVSNVLLWCMFLIQMILFFVVTRSVSEFIKRFKMNAPSGTANRPSIVLGQKAPLFGEQDHRGEIITLKRGVEHRTLLLFTLDTCVVCQKLIPELSRLTAREPSLRVAAVAQEDLSAPDKQVPEGVALIRSNLLIELYEVKQVPYFVLINGEGFITGMGLASTIEQLLEQAELKGGDRHVGENDATAGRFVGASGTA
ncbi:methylamine dehydrogenase accessory protein MauD [Tumebacillus sp. BK434]|uniref:TlpA family protein disulfide reductase n=1 Tax=Tumebacillus sp. BK434 TaxID=2512169 RepID=UPI00104FDC50|nr:hypothetical protein [Tumebacillus sp. BK434]TCP52786.1 methylamine dehydrogenase accessory protein MauD [Tumebacillus sp. BK434]